MIGQLELSRTIILWGLCPITIITLFLNLTRIIANSSNNFQKFGIVDSTGITNTKQNAISMKIIKQAIVLRMKSEYLSPVSYLTYKKYFIGTNNDDGVLYNLKNDITTQASQVPDLKSIMKNSGTNFTFILLNFILAYIFNFYYGGLIIAKLPFEPIESAKTILLRGVSDDLVSAAYISAMSYYFLLLFCSDSIAYLQYYILMKNPPSVSFNQNIIRGPMEVQPMNSNITQLAQSEANLWKIYNSPGFLPNIELDVINAIEMCKV